MSLLLQLEVLSLNDPFIAECTMLSRTVHSWQHAYRMVISSYIKTQNVPHYYQLLNIERQKQLVALLNKNCACCFCRETWYGTLKLTETPVLEEKETNIIPQCHFKVKKILHGHPKLSLPSTSTRFLAKNQSGSS